MPGGLWKLCACLFVECNHQLYLGAPGPALGDRKRTVGSVSPPVDPLVTYHNSLCLAPGPESSGHHSSDWQRIPLHLCRHLAQQLPEGRLEAAPNHLASMSCTTCMLPSQKAERQGAEFPLDQKDQEGMLEEQGKPEETGRQPGKASTTSLLLLSLALTIQMKLDHPSGQVSLSDWTHIFVLPGAICDFFFFLN